MPMRKIFTTRISLQSSTPSYSYPVIRLPRTLKKLAGETVTVYQIEKDGALAFFILPMLDNLHKFIREVDQEEKGPSEAVIDQSTSKNECSRVSCACDHRPLEAPVTPAAARDLGPGDVLIDPRALKIADGPGRIRTGDLRRVKATS